ncbi:MAG: DUF2244 domain-containing protein [Burkholderiales bacterium]|nr:DUF2244 domain-containing protein [Burkholderiales bacterium]
MSSAALRFGVWRPLLTMMQGAAAVVAPDPSGWRAEWLLKRDSAFSRRQLFVLYGALCLVSLGLSLGFWVLGAANVLPFAFVELLIGGVALLMYVRHGADREYIAMRSSLIRVERHSGGRSNCVEFNPRWVRVEPDRDDGSLVRLSGQGRSVVVGEFVQRQYRRQLADEFRWVLKHMED